MPRKKVRPEAHRNKHSTAMLRLALAIALVANGGQLVLARPVDDAAGNPLVTPGHEFNATTLPAKDPDRKGVIAAFEVGASTAKMAAENEALKTESEALKPMLKAKDDKSESVKGLEVHEAQSWWCCALGCCMQC